MPVSCLVAVASDRFVSHAVVMLNVKLLLSLMRIKQLLLLSWLIPTSAAAGHVDEADAANVAVLPDQTSFAGEASNGFCRLQIRQNLCLL